jgi:hypothetical protein
VGVCRFASSRAGKCEVRELVTGGQGGVCHTHNENCEIQLILSVDEPLCRDLISRTCRDFLI